MVKRVSPLDINLAGYFFSFHKDLLQFNWKFAYANLLQEFLFHINPLGIGYEKMKEKDLKDVNSFTEFLINTITSIEGIEYEKIQVKLEEKDKKLKAITVEHSKNKEFENIYHHFCVILSNFIPERNVDMSLLVNFHKRVIWINAFLGSIYEFSTTSDLESIFESVFGCSFSESFDMLISINEFLKERDDLKNIDLEDLLYEKYPDYDYFRYFLDSILYMEYEFKDIVEDYKENVDLYFRILKEEARIFSLVSKIKSNDSFYKIRSFILKQVRIAKTEIPYSKDNTEYSKCLGLLDTMEKWTYNSKFDQMNKPFLQKNETFTEALYSVHSRNVVTLYLPLAFEVALRVQEQNAIESGEIGFDEFLEVSKTTISVNKEGRVYSSKHSFSENVYAVNTFNSIISRIVEYFEELVKTINNE